VTIVALAPYGCKECEVHLDKLPYAYNACCVLNDNDALGTLCTTFGWDRHPPFGCRLQTVPRLKGAFSDLLRGKQQGLGTKLSHAKNRSRPSQPRLSPSLARVALAPSLPLGVSNLQPVLHHAGVVSAQNWWTGENLCGGYAKKISKALEIFSINNTLSHGDFGEIF
jgi:hypothetical protein